MSKLQKLIDELRGLVEKNGDKMETPMLEKISEEIEAGEETQSAVEEPQVEGEPELPIEKQCDVSGCTAKKIYSVRRGNQTCFNLCKVHITQWVRLDNLKRKPKYI